MSALPIDLHANDLHAKPARRWFRRALAERLDALAAYPAKHAVSEQELRRVDEDIKRCRQLMFQNQQRSLKLSRVTATRQARMRDR